jgi:methyl-accepting chemotaxis protein
MSALDGRIRRLAREEAAAMFTTPAAATGADVSTDRVAELQQQITDLHEHLHQAVTVIKRLEARVDVLEKTPPVSEQAKTASRRAAARKETHE